MAFVAVYGTSAGAVNLWLSIYFRGDSAELSDDAKRLCDTIVADIGDRSQGITWVSITGNADAVEAHPDKLSSVRAEKVAEYLRREGVPASITFAIKGVGTTRPLFPPGPKAAEPLNRRVDIELG